MDIPRLVLDTNCLIDLEERRPDSVHLDRLVDAHKLGRVDLAVAAISASENRPSGLPGKNYLLFQDRLCRLGLDTVKHLLPLGTWNVGFWDHMLWSSAALDQEAEAIRGALFPEAMRGPQKDGADDRKWRNRHCDAMLAWCCIHHGWLELVTRDNNFHKRKAALNDLGLHAVWRPDDAASRYAL